MGSADQRMIVLHAPEDFAGMRAAGRLAAATLDMITAEVRPGEGAVLRPGMFLTVEPMVNAGRPDVKILRDGWTAVTRDRGCSAQFEHSVGVTGNGCEVFTLSPAGFTQPPYARA